MNSTAFAQEVVRTTFNGYPYTCTPDSVANDPSNAANCANKAYAGPFTKDQSTQLCSGANNSAPADCAILAYSGPFSADESVNLCTGAYSTGPAICANKAYSGPFTKAQSLELCSSRYATEATANCAINAYSGPYNTDEAVNLCKSRNLESLPSNKKALSKEALNSLIRAANIKAVREGVYKN